MGRIRVLADPLIDRIAAGEVVERPASVVKELVENAIDAGARSLEVRIERGGKQRIRVSDDGCGMDRDDALLALERHATSKLSRAEDLDAITTLGFRGEALSSIASVSRFTLRTAPTAGEGTEVEVHGGRILGVRQIGLPAGTTIQVDRLFYNVPARRKFLRAESTELSHALRWFTRYALAHPGRKLKFHHQDRCLIDAAATNDLLRRIAQIHGKEFSDKLLPFEGIESGIRVHGFAGRPLDALPRRDAQHLFVNDRAVQDRVLSHAVSQAYRNTMPQGRFPGLFLFIEVDANAVDVNVHPQKTEVRFTHSSRVHDLVRDSIAAALSHQRAVPSLSDLRPRALNDARGVREATLGYLEEHRDPPGRSLPQRSPPTARAGESAPFAPALPRPRLAQPELLGTHADPEGKRKATALAQYRESYVLAQDADGLVLVDQHAAHERVLFEKYLADAEAGTVEVQNLMFPVTVELPPAEAILLEREVEEFRRLGFDTEPFGGGTIRIKSIPAVVADQDPAVLLREILGDAATTRSVVSDAREVRLRRITTAACHAAIKIHHPLTLPAMQRLLDDLYESDNPTSCPHGRPALFRLTLDEIERAFRRR